MSFFQFPNIFCDCWPVVRVALDLVFSILAFVVVVLYSSVNVCFSYLNPGTLE